MKLSKEEKMKKIFLVSAIMYLVFFVTFAYAIDEKTTTPEMGNHSMHSGKQKVMGMAKDCPMMKSVKEIKLIMRQVLDLQRRSLNASADEKTKIHEEITDLIKKIDAMPDKMNCPMMNKKRNDSSNQKTLPEEQTSTNTSPSEHKH